MICLTGWLVHQMEFPLEWIGESESWVQSSGWGERVCCVGLQQMNWELKIPNTNNALGREVYKWLRITLIAPTEITTKPVCPVLIIRSTFFLYIRKSDGSLMTILKKLADPHRFNMIFFHTSLVSLAQQEKVQYWQTFGRSQKKTTKELGYSRRLQ